jgi:hypothetical protein
VWLDLVVVIDDYVEAAGEATPSNLGEEKEVWRYESQTPFQVQGFLNTKNMVDEDVLIIREYVSLVYPASYDLLTERTIYGKQKEPLWLIKLLWIPRGYKITITQTQGTLKSYPYYFVAQKVAKK